MLQEAFSDGSGGRQRWEGIFRCQFMVIANGVLHRVAVFDGDELKGGAFFTVGDWNEAVAVLHPSDRGVAVDCSGAEALKLNAE